MLKKFLMNNWGSSYLANMLKLRFNSFKLLLLKLLLSLLIDHIKRSATDLDICGLWAMIIAWPASNEFLSLL
jgi:hypothetical protein